jgi:hypothetical protein
MPARDTYHEAVVTALQKEGWTITHDPYTIKLEGISYDIDLGAEQIIAATKDAEKIAIEIKTFIGPSFVHKFHEAMGQFVNYLVGLEEQEPDRTLYLAVPQGTFNKFFQLPVIQKTLHRYMVKLIIYNPVKQEIIQWIK